MAAKDVIHEAVKNALVKDGWTITKDPYTIKYEDVTLYADIAAERPFAAEKNGEKIVVEAKSFLSNSPMNDLKVAFGQYDIYHYFIDKTEPERKLYLAISDEAYQKLTTKIGIQELLERSQLPLIIVNLVDEEIVQWIN